MQIVNLDPKLQPTGPLFFGKDLGIQRYDIFKYRELETLTKKQLSYFWNPEEIDVSPDKSSWEDMTDAYKHIYLSNLKYQVLLDTIQGRGPLATLGSVASFTELESCVSV